MNLLLVPPTLCAVVSFAIGAFVLSKNPRSSLHRSFTLLCWETTWWQVCWFATYFFSDPIHKDLIMRIAYITITVLPVTYYHYAVRFLGKDQEWRFVRLGYLIGLSVFMPLLWTTNLYIAGHIDHWWGYYPRVGVLHPIYLVSSLTIVIRSLFILRTGAKDPTLPPAARNRNRFAFYSHFVYSLAVVEYAITYDVIKIYPVGVFAMLGAFGITAYAIVRHRLMDISVAVTRTAVFTIVYASVLGLPLLAALSWQPQLEQRLGSRWWIGLWITCSALATVAHYANLHFQRRAEAALLAEERKAHEALQQISQNMMRFTRLKVLLESSTKYLVRILQVSHAAIYLFDEAKGVYERRGVWHSPPRKESPLPASLPAEAAVLQDLAAGKLPRVREELRLQERSMTPHWQTMVDEMERLQASVVIPAFKQTKLFGFMLLGEKRSRRIWSQDDLNVLMVVANQAALAVENAQLHEAEEQRLIKEAIEQTAADISYGVSHQFNNRLYVISILAAMPVLALADKNLEALSPEDAKTWLKRLVEEMKKITTEAEMGGQISKGIMSLAKAIPEEFKPAEIPPLIAHAIEFVRIKHAREKVEGEEVEPAILNEVPEHLAPILGNAAQLHDSFMNLIDNAMDAIREKIFRLHRGDLPAGPAPYKGQIRIQAAERDSWLSVVIEDDGIGIEKENLRKVFVPYFTTKATGVKGRGLGGHGLGLYFIKKIVEAHQGKVYAQSEYPRWTRFTVELPIPKEACRAA